MRCFEIDHLGRVSGEGIQVAMRPEPHVRIGWTLGHEGKTVPIDKSCAKHIVWKPEYGRGYDSQAGRYKTMLKSERHLLKEAGVDAGRSRLTAPLPDEGDAVMVCWHLISGYGGEVRLTPNGLIEEIARGSHRLTEAETGLAKLDILAVLRPGGSIVMNLTGEVFGSPFGELTYRGGGAAPEVRLSK